MNDTAEDPQCTKTAAYEYGQELRCHRLADHEGECEA